MDNRRVHLDFHTSPDISGIGEKFDKKQFQSALKEGNLSSITIFAKCHHGYCYYPTEIGTMHPGLNFDLLGEMMDAAHEIGVNAPVYITTGWSDLDSTNHPEWRSKNMEGAYQNMNPAFDENSPADAPRPEAAWKTMCLNDGSYTKHIYDITEEICKRYKRIDGLFYDICFVDQVCFCDECRDGMKKAGFNPENWEDARKYYVEKHIDFMKKCGDILKKYHKDATIFFNSGGADINMPEFHPYESHYEMEDLPTNWGGYDKMPLNATYFSKYDKKYIGMTGKFHLAWGEFGGFKCADALKYEVATMGIYGAGCSIGDHMFPDGEMDMQTYKNIGEAYKYYEKMEPYVFGESTSSVGLYLSVDPEANSGVSKALIESQIDFSVVDNDFSKYDLVIFPAKCNISSDMVVKLNDYINNGGKVLFCFDALYEDGKFLIDAGLKNPSYPTKDCDYIIPKESIAKGLPESPSLIYHAGMNTEAEDCEIYAEYLEPLFSRTYGKFCGHKNTPYDKNGKKYPAITKKGNVVYLAHNMARVYSVFGSIYHKRFILNAINLLNPSLALKTDLYAQGRCRMIKQPENNRYCINMTYAAPVKRGCAEIIEDIIPIYNRPFEISVCEDIKEVYLPLKDKSIPFTKKNGKIAFTLDEIQLHETVVLKY